MEHAGFQHQALIYEGAAEYLEGTIPYLRAALEAGEPALVAVRRERARLLQGELGRDADRVRFLPVEEVARNPALIVPLWRDFVEENDGHAVRGVSEPLWPQRSPAAREESHRHEALLNLAFGPAPTWSLLCPYDACALSDDDLEMAATTHELISREGRTEESAAFAPELDTLGGELPPPVRAAEVVSFGLEELSEVRGRVAAAGERAGMDPRSVADLVTAASELAANSVMHGGGQGTLRLWRDNGSLLAEVEDAGQIDEQLVGRLRPSLTQEGGRGLWLANQLCDLVQIRSGDSRTVVRLHMSVQVGGEGGDEDGATPGDSLARA
ncbi:MAG TPA: sensor histidine kinase [Solirubrobacterales bacterium]|nr:sensor histidine kinase [Solirubrobacterales bacterium]